MHRLEIELCLPSTALPGGGLLYKRSTVLPTCKNIVEYVIDKMFTKPVLPFFAMQMLASATPHQHRRANGVDVTDLNKNVSSTSGSGNVAAAGGLTPFGDIGVGCGINWQADVSYGGTLLASLSNSPYLTRTM
jgi:hypothetical protein